MIISEKTKIANDEHIKKIIIINKRMIRSEKMKNQKQKRQINFYKKFELAQQFRPNLGFSFSFVFSPQF